jgi:hypothetical protein
MLQTCRHMPVTWRSVCNNKKTMSSDIFATLYNTLSHIDTLNSYEYPTFFFYFAVVTSYRYQIKSFFFVFWIKIRTYIYRSASKKFLRRRRRHILQTLHLKARCSSLWLLCLEFYSLPRTLALRLRQLRPKVVSGQDPSSLPRRASRLQKVV